MRVMEVNQHFLQPPIYNANLPGCKDSGERKGNHDKQLQNTSWDGKRSTAPNY